MKDKIEVDGKYFRKVPEEEIGSCKGCVGEKHDIYHTIW